MTFDEAIEDMPIIAIARGLPPAEAPAVADILMDAGIHCIEVPLNRPTALTAITALAKHVGARAAIGAGTVLTPADVSAAREAGATFVVSPNVDVAMLRAARAASMPAIPGFFTPTEALLAVSERVAALKFFPIEGATPAMLKSIAAILPDETRVFGVGGVTVEHMAPFIAAGAAGFGCGTSLWAPGIAPEDLSARARGFVETMRALRR